MRAIVTYPFNNIDYDDKDVAAYNSTRTSGVYSSDEDFAVTAAGGMDVTVSAGRAWVHPERFTGYSVVKREADTLTLPLADGTLARIDRIVLRFDAASRKTSLQVLTGDPASTPTAPAITRTALIYDLCLAEIARPAGSTSIATSNITDTRMDEDLCGVMTDGVTGIPTDALLAQAQARIGEIEEQATTSANAADKSAKAASASESTAKTAASTATTQASAAKGSAEKAATSESNANTAASTAATKATEASSSASAAAKSQQDAEASKEAAAASEANAKAAADRAAQVTTNTYLYEYDLVLQASGWTECADTDAKTTGLSYQYDAAIEGCTAELIPTAVIEMASIIPAQKAGFGTVCSTENSCTRFYAAKIPASDISLHLQLLKRTTA